MCYTINFKTSKDNKQATLILQNHSLKNTDLQSQIQLTINNIQDALYKSKLFSILQRQETIQYIDLSQYYREKKLFKRVKIRYKLKIQNIQLVFNQSHQLCLNVKAHLTLTYKNQER